MDISNDDDNPFQKQNIQKQKPLHQVKLQSSVDYENPLGIMICAHGSFPTTMRNSEIRIPVQIEIPQSTIHSFSADGESCAYPPDSMMELTRKMQQEFNDKNRRITKESFLEKVEKTQMETLGFKYNSKDWASKFSKKPGFTGNVVFDRTTYFEKIFTSADDYPGFKSGVYVFYKEDARIRDFYPIEYDFFQDRGYTFLSSILKYFATRYLINNFYIFDATCSIIDIPGQAVAHFPNTIDKRHAARTVRANKGGRGKRRKTKSGKTKRRKNK